MSKNYKGKTMFGTQKQIFLFFQLTIIIGALLLIGFFQPEENGWWIFKHTEYPNEFFTGIAFLIASFYMLLLTIWYNDSQSQFSWRTALISFILAGGISIFICQIFYPLWDFIFFKQVESGWWIFKSTGLFARDPFIAVMDYTGAIAGPVEELSKLLAVLLIPQVRNAIKDRKTGVFYVVLCAFGFAMIENIMYFINYEEVLLVRANPAHAVFSAIWGSALGSWLAKEISFKKFLKYLFWGMCLHASWNYFASIGSIIFCFIFVLSSLIGLAYIKKELNEISTTNDSLSRELNDIGGIRRP
jgi:RsiW-degrading membrane proteinase PrsW (M82 family)